MELFELYFNSFGFSIVAASLIARLIVIFEFSLAIMLIFNVQLRRTLGLSLFLLAILIGLSVFQSSFGLVYPYHLSTGNYFIFQGFDTIYYALIIFGLILYLRKIPVLNPPKQMVGKRFLVFAMLGLSFGFPLIYSAPDFVLFQAETVHEARKFQNDSLYESLRFTSNLKPQASDEPYILLAVTPGCPFCKLLTTRVYFLQQYGFIDLPIYFLMLSSDPQDADRYWSDNHTAPFPIATVDNLSDFISIVGNTFPALYLMRGTQFYAKMDFRDFRLSRLQQF